MASARVTHLTHRYLLPIAGTFAVTLGLLILVGEWRTTGPALYWTLLAVGVGALLSSFGYLVWQEGSARRRAATTPAPEPIEASPAPMEESSPSIATEPATAPLGRPHSGLGRAVVGATHNPGDELWQHWVPLKTAPLGVEASGPVGESWYYPAKSGAIAPFASRDRDLVFLAADRSVVELGASSANSDRRTNRPPAPISASRASSLARTQPFSEVELDSLFPTEAETVLEGPFPALPPPMAAPTNGGPLIPVRSPAAPSVAPGIDATRPATPASWEVPGTGAAALSEASSLYAGPTGSLTSLDSLDHQIYLEAINPMPPHLRTALPGPPTPKSDPAPARSPPAALDEFCAMCTRKLSDFRSWAECPRCSRAMCRDCLGVSFLTGAEGRCFACREPHGQTAT